ncbi:MAG TPA: hypothetical protein VHO06_19160 [Polyangia bacterium]|nr:hypothetical protein [Polyangia bacterium]
MRNKLSAVVVATCVILGASAFSLPANAAWPSGAVRTISGYACTPFQNAIDSYIANCPFVSDYSGTTDMFGGGFNSGIYGDFHTSGADTVAVTACRQSWSGGSADCNLPGIATATGAGNFDVNAAGFGIGTISEWDYYFVTISAEHGAVDQIYGVGYY